MTSAEKFFSTWARASSGLIVEARSTASHISSTVSTRKPVLPCDRDHRRARRHRLGHHEPEGLGPLDREQHGVRAREEVGLLLDGDLAQDLFGPVEARRDVLVPVPLLGLLRHLYGHDELATGTVGDVHGDLRALLAIDAPEEEEEVLLLGSERVARDVDSVVDRRHIGKVGAECALSLADGHEPDSARE